MANLLGLTLEYLGTALVAPDRYARIRRLLRRIPPLSGLILECRLAPDTGAVDVSVRAVVEDGGRDVLAGRDRALALAPSLWEAQAWQRIRHFCQGWAEAGTPLNEHVETTWVEFDDADLERAVPVPCFFFDAPGASSQKAAWVPDIAFATLLGTAPNAATRRHLLRCLDALPEAARIHYFGVLLSRPTEALRFCATLPRTQVRPYLRALGWHHDEGQVARLLEEIVAEHADTVVLDLDVGPERGSALGIEVKPKAGWEGFLLAMGKRGWCAGPKGQALLRWPGHSPGWPDGAAHASGRIPDDAEAAWPPLQFRRINHAKFTLKPGCSLELKVYIYAGFRWVNNQTQEGSTTL